MYELGGNARGDPWYGRPARYVGKTALGHMSPTYAPHTIHTTWHDASPDPLANAPLDNDDAPRPHSLSTRCSIFPYNASTATTIDTTTVDASLIVDSHTTTFR